jgi:sugar phosphate isomerase/epimerase
MQNFLIGMYGKCDEEKFKRDFVHGFYGVEASMFPEVSEIKKLSEKAERCRFQWGAHYPLLRKNRPTRDPLFLSLDTAERARAFRDFNEETALVSQHGGAYLLTHIPKPVLVSDTFNFSFWRFANDKEWMYERDYPREALEENLYGMFFKLDAVASRYGIQLILENDAMSPLLSQSTLLECLFDEFRRIKACLDIARLHLQQAADKAFNGMAFAAKIAPYTALLHLWNGTPTHNASGGHIPVSPEQKQEDGYADIRAYLELVLAKGRHMNILFEHRSDLVTNEELMACYEWVDEIQKNVR